MPDGPPMAWIVAILGLWVAVSPFVLGASGIYLAVLVVSGLIVAALAAYRGMNPDEKVPLPALPLVIVFFGIVTVASPYVFGDGLSSTLGQSLVFAGAVFIVLPLLMVVLLNMGVVDFSAE